MRHLQSAFLALTVLSSLPAAAADLTFAERCEQEIHDLHAFFQQWSVGELPDTDEAYARLGDALAPGFTMVDTDGRTMARGDVLDGLRGANHRWPGGGAIEISDVATAHVAGDLAVLTYVEHHDFDAGEGRQMSKRRSTVVFRDEAGAPNGVRWLHVQETWIAPPHLAHAGHAEHSGHGGSEWKHSGEHGAGHAEGHGEMAHPEMGHGEMGHGDHNSPGFQHDFSDVERWAKIFDDPERVDWQKPEHLIDLMKIEPGMHVADLGAGTGFFLGYLSVAVGETGKVQALDVADTLVDHMRERAAEAGWNNVTSRVVATDDPAFEPGSMDRILIVDVWHHISNRADYATKLRDALSPTGQVVVVDFTLDSPEGPPKQHRMAPEKVAAELEAGGLKAWVVESEELPRQYVVMASR